MTFTTRFAPSPTGPLHLGHAYSALLAHDLARARDGAFLLRIEDLDAGRARAEWEDLIYTDLRWLGVDWDGDVLRQSDHMPVYADALDRLAGNGLIYPCSCNRRDIRAALSAPQEGAAPGAAPYPGLCRGRDMSSRLPGDALRLDLARAVASLTDIPLPGFTETGDAHRGHHVIDADRMIATMGDPVLGRKELETASYLLSAVVDDARQDITTVIRGEDMFEITEMQVLLQALLELPTPVYHHHRLIRDDAGKRLAKRDDACAISKYRTDGASPAGVRAMVGL